MFHDESMAVTTVLSHLDVGAAILQIAAENVGSRSGLALQTQKALHDENYKNNKASANTCQIPDAQCMVKISLHLSSSFGV